MNRILVLEKNHHKDSLSGLLNEAGFSITQADSRHKVIDLLEMKRFHILLIGLDLLEVQLEELCIQVRKISSIPIIIVTVNPSIKVLVTISSGCRRLSNQNQQLADRISYGNGLLRINTSHKKVCIAKQKVNVTSSEYKLMLVLASHPNRIFNREELIEKIYG